MESGARRVSCGGTAAVLVLALATTGAGAQGPGGTLVVVNKGAASASVIDVTTGKAVALLPTGDGPHELALSSDGRTAVATNYGGQAGGNSLTVIDVPSASVVSSISLGQYRRPHGAAFLPGDSLLAVTSESSEAVLVVRVRDGRLVRALRTGQSGSHMLAVTGDGRTIYTGNIGANTITELDVVEGQKRLFQVPEQPEAITVAADGSEVWVGSNAHGRVSVVSTRDGSVATPLEGFGFPYRIVLVPERGIVLVPDARNNTLRVFALESHEETGRLDFPGAGPQGIAVTPDGRWAFQSLSAEGRVALIDLDALAVVRYLASGAGPDGVVWSPLAARATAQTAAQTAAQTTAQTAAPSTGQTAPANGDQTSAPANGDQTSAQEAVRAAIDRLFDGMREADGAKVRSVMADGARFAVVSEREGRTVIEYPAVDGWIAGVAGSQGRWDERITDVVIQVDADMASAWTPYSFYLDGALRHCGVNSIELRRTGEGWKVTQLSDTRRTEGCRELPPGR